MSDRPGSAAEYVGLVRQAIFDIEDSIEAMGYDLDEIDDRSGYLQVLLKELRAMRATMADGSYRFDRHDLPMMRILKGRTEQDLPCIRLLYLINRTHREGLDITAG